MMLRNIGEVIYSLIRFSRFYSLYLRLFRKSIYANHQMEAAFYKSLLGTGRSLIFDVGANVGDKTSLFASLGHEVVAVDPDRTNAKILKRRFFFNKRVKLKVCALGDKVGKQEFFIIDSGSPANTLSKKWKSVLEDEDQNRWSRKVDFQDSYEVEVQTIENLMSTYGCPHYAKIDVEGYELEVLSGMKTVPNIISLEANLPEFREEMMACVERLQALAGELTFNVIDSRHTFLWPQKVSFEELMKWLKTTDWRYFEIFSFRPGN